MNRMKQIVAGGAMALSMLAATQAHGATLLGLWQFEDASGADGATILDSSGNDRHGIVGSGSINLVSSVNLAHGNAGQFGAGRVSIDFSDLTPARPPELAGPEFNGVYDSQYLNNPAGGGSPRFDFTIAFWMKANSTAAGQNSYILARNGAGGGVQHGVLYGYAAGAAEMWGNMRHNLITIPDTNWHHVVYTRTGDQLQAYLDGNLVGTVSEDTHLALNHYLHLGAAYGATGRFNGALDDVAYFDGGITAQEVSLIMNGDFSSFPIPEPASLALVGMGGLLLWRRRR